MSSYWKERYTEEQLEKKRLADRLSQQRLRRESKRAVADLEERLELSIRGEHATLIRRLLNENSMLRSVVSHYRSRLGDIMVLSQECLDHDAILKEAEDSDSRDSLVDNRHLHEATPIPPLQRPPPMSRYPSILFHATTFTKEPASVLSPSVSMEAILESVTAWKLSSNHGFDSQFVAELFALNQRFRNPSCTLGRSSRTIAAPTV